MIGLKLLFEIPSIISILSYIKTNICSDKPFPLSFNEPIKKKISVSGSLKRRFWSTTDWRFLVGIFSGLATKQTALFPVELCLFARLHLACAFMGGSELDILHSLLRRSYHKRNAKHFSDWTEIEKVFLARVSRRRRRRLLGRRPTCEVA